MPCSTATTGFGHASTAEIHCWNSKMWLRSRSAVRATSVADSGDWDRAPEPEDAACTSRPAVKARPAPVRRMVRTDGSVDSAVKIWERECHILVWGEGGLVYGRLGVEVGCGWGLGIMRFFARFQWV
jgi:hypothetical protein